MVGGSRAPGVIVVHSYRKRTSVHSFTRRGPHPSDLIPHWASIGPPGPEFAQGVSDNDRQLAIGFGFPIPSLWYEERNTSSPPSNAVKGCIDLGPSTRRLQQLKGCRRRLPLLPIWTGFTINTVFYAAILWLLIPGPFVLRRLIRSRRGHCIKCGYDLRGSPEAGCPECGWNREKETAS